MISTETKICFNGPLPESTTYDELYDYYLQNIYSADLRMYGTRIKTFETPIEDNKMQGFFHLTTKTQKQFGIKIRMKEYRAYFINYVPIMINNFEKCNKCKNNMCNKIKVWTAPFKNTKRTKLLYTDEHYSYIVVLERKGNELYIITSYLIDERHYLKKVLQEYNEYKKNS